MNSVAWPRMPGSSGTSAAGPACIDGPDGNGRTVATQAAAHRRGHLGPVAGLRVARCRSPRSPEVKRPCTVSLSDSSGWTDVGWSATQSVSVTRSPRSGGSATPRSAARNRGERQHSTAHDGARETMASMTRAEASRAILTAMKEHSLTFADLAERLGRPRYGSPQRFWASTRSRRTRRMSWSGS